ncbi:MAG: hypothetical protein IJ702_01160 [Fretibacterium sp.]|nr:hypothetical protein [Fretibacterium sp.]
MRRRARDNLLGRLIYYILFIAILMGTVWFYFFWLNNYRLSHPQVIEAEAAGYVEEQPLDGILLWDEQLIYAPQDGLYTYLSPQPRRVAKGEILAALDGAAVRAPYPAYFYPALDGQEGQWIYSRLWPEFAPFPFFRPAVLLENGIQLHKGAPIGKLVPQPQVLRCIAYLDSTPSLERRLRMKDAAIRIKTELDGKERKAEIVAFKSAGPARAAASSQDSLRGQKIKVYLRLPFFPPALLRSRAFSARVVTGDQYGVMVPDSAVITKDGRNFVFLLQGSNIISQDVDGFPADEKNFFIVKGVSPGNSLLLDADSAQEGPRRMW